MCYYLKNKKATAPTPLNIMKRINGSMFKYSVGVKVLPVYWNSKTKQIKKGYPDYSRINKFLDKLSTRFDTVIWDLKSEEQLTHENLRKNLDSIIGRERNESKKLESFSEVWKDGWMKWLQQEERAKSTIDKKGYTLKSLLDFEMETGYTLSFDTMNENFARKYKIWALNAVKQNGKPRYTKDNAIHKNISIVKEFLKWANSKGYTNLEYYKGIMGYNEEYFAPFALSSSDISMLMKLDIQSVDLDNYEIRPCNHEKVKIALERTRDAFVFRCLCGIRYSDYSQLTSSKLKNGSINLVTQKTNTQIQLPLHSYAKKILSENDYCVPILANQNENENLKLLARVAGFTEKETVSFLRGGKRIEEVKERWELVSTHTARKTFITNCLRAGIEQYVVMEIVGIKKESTFKRYVQVSGHDINKAMQKYEALYSF